MAEVDPLILELKADIRGFGTELTQAQRVADKRLSAIEASGVRMGQKIGGAFKFASVAAAGFVASIGVDAVVQAVQAGLEYASSLGEVAQQLGVTTDALQEYRFAASQAGLSTDEIDQALGQLTRRIGEGVNGTKAQADAFKRLGISLKDANGDVIATGEAIPLIAEALKKIESPAEKSAILLDLFGKSGQKLLPLLADGAEGVNGLRDAARDLGIVLSEKQIQDADETADKLSKLKQVLAAKIAGAVADNTDSIIALAEALVQLVGSIGTAIKEYNRLREAFGANGQIAIGNILGGPSSQLGGQFIQSGLRRREAQRGQAFRDKFSDIDASSVAKRSTQRSNFAAQGPSGFDLIGNELRGGSAASAKAINGTLTTSQQELLSIFVELNAVAADLIDTIEARVEAEKIQIEADKIRAIDRINANDELTKAQKEQARQGIEAIAAGQIELANAKLAAEAKQKAAEAAQDAADLADIEAQNAVAALEGQYDLATSIAERARIAAQIVETETAAALAAVDAQLLQEDITEAKRQQLEAIRRGIVAEGQSNQRKAAEGNRGAASTYLAELNKLDPADQAERFGVDALKDLNAGLADAIVNGSNLGDVLENTGKRFLAQLIELTFQLLVIKPLLESLGNAAGGSGGSASGLGSIFGSLFGRASGGPVSAGQVYRVNEGVGKEFFRPNTGGDIIPLSKMNAAQRGGGQGGVTVVRLELSGDIDARIEEKSAEIAVQVNRALEDGTISKAVAETFRRGQRPSIGR